MTRCTAQTTKGRQCKQKAVEGFEYCPRHKEIHVDLVAEMEAVAAANRVREEKLKQKIDKLEQLLVRANRKAEADNAARKELAVYRSRQLWGGRRMQSPGEPHEKQEEGGGVNKGWGGWLVLGLVLVGIGGTWWRRKGC